MQKVFKRTALAKAQAARRANIRASKERSTERVLQRKEQDFLSRRVYLDIKAAQLARREDRELGPLAPKRDVGTMKDTYGTMDPRRLRGLKKSKEERGEAQLIVPGDRVVLVEGRDKGRIGEVKSVDKERHECIVAGLNMVDVAVPPWMQQEGQARVDVQSMEASIPLPSLRLVHALTDPDTGHTRDVIVKKIIVRDAWHDRHLGIHRRFRMIPGLNVEVPWPKKAPKEYVDNEIDTLRLDVEARTWIPSMLRAPIPRGVIDELRNKYSKFRDRHEESYIAKKIAEDEEAKREKQRLKEAAMSPLMEAKRKERREKKARGRTRLSEETLSKIGEVMAQSRGLTDGAKDISIPA